MALVAVVGLIALGAAPARAQAPAKEATQTAIILSLELDGIQSVIGAVEPSEFETDVIFRFSKKTPSGWAEKDRQRVPLSEPSDTFPRMNLFSTSVELLNKRGKCKITVRYPGTETLAPSSTRQILDCRSGYVYE